MSNYGMGFNIDGQFLDNADKNWIESIFKGHNPKAVVVLSDINYAIRLKNLLPKTQVIFRNFWGDEYDNIHRTTTVNQFLQIYDDALKNDLIVYSNNEPTLDDSLIAWEYELSSKIIERNKKAVQFNWSVGMPNNGDADYDKFKKNLKIITENKNNLYLGLHEYWFGWPFAEFGISPIYNQMKNFTLSDKQKPYVIGRYRWISDYCKRKFNRTANIIFTEFGYDEVDALLYLAGQIPYYKRPMRMENVLPALEVWRTQSNMDIYEYAFEQFRLVWEKVYKNSPEIKGVCTFPFGGTGAWGVSSLHRHRGLVKRLIEDYSFETVATSEDNNEDMIRNANIKRKIYSGIDINFRIKPNTVDNTPLFVLTAGTEVFVFENNNVTANNLVWTPMIAKNNGLWNFGWIATSLNGVFFSEVNEGLDIPRIRDLISELGELVNNEQ